MRKLISLLLFALLFSGSVQAADNTALAQALSAIKQGQTPTTSMLDGLAKTPDGMLLLGRLYEFGSYGVKQNGERAYQLYQQAAEVGQMQAALYCWKRCLRMTPALVNAVTAAAKNGSADGMYLRAKWLADIGEFAAADHMLVAAAKAHQYQALNELYIQHFLQWSANQTEFSVVEDKLKRCVKEGLVSCHLLLGKLYQRYGDANQALHQYLMLIQLDYPLSHTYLYANEMEALLDRLPEGSRTILQSRVATALVHQPHSGFDQLDRFHDACADLSTYACVRQVVKRDNACMISAFAGKYLQNFRKSDVYRQCIGLVQPVTQTVSP